MTASEQPVVHKISVVVPVYQGETTLGRLVEELAPLTSEQPLAAGGRYAVIEVILVHDCGPDRSDRTIVELAQAHAFVKPVWLTKNYGQHPATLAGMASSTGHWVVTMDEDGQQDPRDIAALLAAALEEKFQLVYAKPTNPPPHGFLRNALSVWAKRVAGFAIGTSDISRFNSFRLIDGEIARSLAAYCGSGVFLDVALLWITSAIGQFPLKLREEMGRPSGYSFTKLIRHFWHLLLTSGTRPLRFITIFGFGALLLAMGITAYALWEKLQNDVPVQGWTSLVIVMAFFSGAILMSLGIIAEYLAVTMTIVMGRPPYVVGTKPAFNLRRR